MNNHPIGIFDSGIGGLTVAKAIIGVLPKESIIYFGDTAHMPYGDKSVEAIKYFSIKIANFLLVQKCKAIVIACNTASSMAYSDLREMIPEHIPIINVIDPVVEYIGENNWQRIGVIATKGTIKTNAYGLKITEKYPNIQVASLATPLLAPMIEEGFFNNNISKTIIHSYLSKPKLKKIQALIPACTHYPLIQPEIEAYYKGEVEILNTANITAKYTQKVLKSQKLLSDNTEAKHQFIVSDHTASFEKSTQLFFDQKIHLEQNNIWA